MTVTGTIYGVVLNDLAEREALGGSLEGPPYMASPRAPVVYIKPRASLSVGAAGIPCPPDLSELAIASTLGLLFVRDAASVASDEVGACIGAACLALDVSVPQENYYRPAIAQRCRDGFLPIGGFAWPTLPNEIVTLVDGAEVHRWSTDRLVRSVDELVHDLSDFMTLRSGDLLLIGVPGDAPRAAAGAVLRVEALGLPSLTTFVQDLRA